MKRLIFHLQECYLLLLEWRINLPQEIKAIPVERNEWKHSEGKDNDECRLG